MYINITDSTTADNKSSSHDLVHYLEKENRTDKEHNPELWFNQDRTTISAFDTRLAIDNNIAKLSKQDAKFFLINISPSQKEIAWLKERYGDEGAKEQLKAYAVKVMDEYAKNFKRPGINSNKDLLWFGKLENYRYYGHKDPEVKQGLKKRGERKPGEQMHIQVIVSRKDITNKIKLSPNNNSKGRNAEHSRRMGQFDRSAFKQSGEKVFDHLFNFERGFDETFNYANAKKKGLLDERVAMRTERSNNSPGQRPVARQEFAPAHKEPQLKLALGKTQAEAAPYIPIKKKKKRSKEQEQDQGLSF
ncbi:molybdopterin-guanine dinucleotide biosynthesis protein MobB [Mucilaginibacter rubeus]|uniref:Molybdopterin-guanine dinucleotide biosynthesis protein MobB n=1 Tax=Mucilaginibacter rubeus TaxID=2027860 RepID=A0AAE6JCK9_9SPHI|nr:MULTISPECIES: DUF5712 family protein [Mucilaginibacter]QEM03103.1 molybdopterin-guanine dinucleotide biosynthesis protein MobB [Mucilaginibacter rubeus]QEM15721.1 molybdopterin-guanine dinucleotide biosynthesis protein MobB [Mucilaginibacter gossypii]QTE41539.1 molybdopterin-guanine dinucleotide biosynthesis protein MobB [Mucilaginibacter rubeus]QTE48145.1 molybdopterin-guanine dinucleotide biosynthesis protein MobB [Mucilaginibacter rubeus]QTE59536.1 molybdopterin-guanine dinucleotide bios